MNRYTKQQVLEAVKDSQGFVVTVAQRLGCDWATAWKYVQKWKATRVALENEYGTLFDQLTVELLNRALSGNVKAVICYLELFGRHRWSENVQQQTQSINAA